MPSKTPQAIIDEIVHRRARGDRVKTIAHELGIGVTTVVLYTPPRARFRRYIVPGGHQHVIVGASQEQAP